MKIRFKWLGKTYYGLAWTNGEIEINLLLFIVELAIHERLHIENQKWPERRVQRETEKRLKRMTATQIKRFGRRILRKAGYRRIR